MKKALENLIKAIESDSNIKYLDAATVLALMDAEAALDIGTVDPELEAAADRAKKILRHS